MKLGYARVSTNAQELDLQRNRLQEAGCETLFEEKISGAGKKRPELEKLLDQLRKGDVVVVTRLDRLARSTAELLRIAEMIGEKDAGLQSLAEPWADTTSPSGRMILTVFAGIAEFERTLYPKPNRRRSTGSPATWRPFRTSAQTKARATRHSPSTYRKRKVRQRSSQKLQRPSRHYLSLHREKNAL